MGPLLPRGRGGATPRQWGPGGAAAAGSRHAASGSRAGASAAAAVMVRPLNCIVAVSQNMGIGRNGDLPWPSLRYRPARAGGSGGCGGGIRPRDSGRGGAQRLENTQGARPGRTARAAPAPGRGPSPCRCHTHPAWLSVCWSPTGTVLS